MLFFLHLEKSLEEWLNLLGSRATDARRAIEYFYTQSAATTPMVTRVIKKSNVCAYKLVADMENLGILKEITGAQKGRVYLFKEYLDLFNFKD